jgi:hypothetical protein
MSSYLETRQCMMAEMDQMPSDTGELSVRTYIDTFMARQGKHLNTARRSQEATNDGNLKKRYANYQRLPQLMTRTKRGSANEEDEHPKDAPAPIANRRRHATEGSTVKERRRDGSRPLTISTRTSS